MPPGERWMAQQLPESHEPQNEHIFRNNQEHTASSIRLKLPLGDLDFEWIWNKQSQKTHQEKQRALRVQDDPAQHSARAAGPNLPVSEASGLPSILPHIYPDLSTSRAHGAYNLRSFQFL
jgi:hypothetical protein